MSPFDETPLEAYKEEVNRGLKQPGSGFLVVARRSDLVAALSVSVGRMDNRTVVRVAGELDLASATDLRAELARVSGPLDIDCSRLEFIDLAGLRVLVQAAASHGQVTLHNAPPLLVKLAELAGWDDVLRIRTLAPPRGAAARGPDCCPDIVLS